MSPSRISSLKPKYKPIKFIPAYKSPIFHTLRRPHGLQGPVKAKPNRTGNRTPNIHVMLSTNDNRLPKVSNHRRSQIMNRQHQEITRMIKSAMPGPVNVIVKDDKRVSKIMANLSYQDLEMAKTIEQLRTASGISDAQMKRGVRLFRTMQKLAGIVFAKEKLKGAANGAEDWRKTAELLNELKTLTGRKKSDGALGPVGLEGKRKRVLIPPWRRYRSVKKF
uniref:Uncharacterized protein n=1 Tax=Strigamia maritima TaxID=126957 RepID=T1J7F2_STRMM